MRRRRRVLGRAHRVEVQRRRTSAPSSRRRATPIRARRTTSSPRSRSGRRRCCAPGSRPPIRSSISSLSDAGQLQFANAAVDAGVATPASGYQIQWADFDNATGEARPVGAPTAVTEARASAPPALVAGAARGPDHPGHDLRHARAVPRVGATRHGQFPSRRHGLGTRRSLPVSPAAPAVSTADHATASLRRHRRHGDERLEPCPAAPGRRAGRRPRRLAGHDGAGGHHRSRNCSTATPSRCSPRSSTNRSIGWRRSPPCCSRSRSSRRIATASSAAARSCGSASRSKSWSRSTSRCSRRRCPSRARIRWPASRRWAAGSSSPARSSPTARRGRSRPRSPPRRPGPSRTRSTPRDWTFAPAPWGALIVWPFFNYLLAALAYLFGRHAYGMTVAAHAAEELGSYRLVSRIGEGGMGEVWKASHQMLARAAAIKLVRPQSWRVGAAGGRHRAALQARSQRHRQPAVAAHGLSLRFRRLGGRPLLLRHGTARRHQPAGAGHDVRPAAGRRACLPILRRPAARSRRRTSRGWCTATSSRRTSCSARSRSCYDFVKVARLRPGQVPEQRRRARSSRWRARRPARRATWRRKSRSASRHVDGRADVYALGCVAYFLLTGTLVFQRPESDEHGAQARAGAARSAVAAHRAADSARARAHRAARAWRRSRTTGRRAPASCSQMLDARARRRSGRTSGREAVVGAQPAAHVVAALVRAGRLVDRRRSCGRSERPP